MDDLQRAKKPGTGGTKELVCLARKHKLDKISEDAQKSLRDAAPLHSNANMA